MMNKNGHEVGHAPGRSNSLRQVTRHVIWARGAGRCHICNVDLIGDLISGAEDANFGFIAHIVADTPTGPRGDPIRSRKLSDDPDNLMLLCYKHHKAVDVDMVDDYPEAKLLGIEREQSGLDSYPGGDSSRTSDACYPLHGECWPAHRPYAVSGYR